MSKRVLSLVLALVMVLGAFSTVFAAETENAKVKWLQEEGLVVGDAGTGDLRLADPIKRSEVAVMVVKALDLGAVANASAAFPSVFKDMSPVHWANGFVNVAAGRGFISGYPNGNFLPENNVNYAEMASMLVRVLGGLTEAEAKAAVWPTTYLAKAVELGLFDGVAVVNYNEPATRENVFEMVYNAVVNAQAGNYTIVKGIVLENYRVETLDKDEVVVELISILQKADFAEKSRADKGDQLPLVIPAKVGDVEELLGKVADFTLDKDGKVVAVKVDNTYKYEVGSLVAIDEALKVEGKEYTVVKAERYSQQDRDDRIFRTYLNNKSMNYSSFAKETKYDHKDVTKADFARVTTKNGKVLFIDAFNFDDVAPVADVKSDGEVVYILDDVRDGAQKKLTFDSKTKVVSIKDKVMNAASLEDIDVMDVIHTTTSGNTVFVRQDAAIEGTYEKYVTAKIDEADVVKIYVDGESYTAGFANKNKAVFSVDGEEFQTLEKNKVSELLAKVRKEEVVLLLDMNNKVQYVASDVVDPAFYALVVDTIRGEVRFAKADGTRVDLVATFDSDITFAGSTRQRNVNELNAGDLVKVTAKDGDIAKLERIEQASLIKSTAKSLTKLNKDYVEVNGARVYLDAKTKLFVEINDSKKMKGIDITTLVDNYKVVDGNEAYVNSDHNVIVFTVLESKGTDTKTLNARVVEIWDTSDGYVVLVEDVNGDRTEHAISATNAKAVRKGDIVKFTVTKDDAEDVKAVEVLIAAKAKVFEVVSFNGYNKVELAGTNTNTREFIVLRSAPQFGDLGVGEFISVKLNADNDIIALEVRDDSYDLGKWADILVTTTPEKSNAEKAKAIDDAIDALPSATDIASFDEAELVAAMEDVKAVRDDYTAETADVRILVTKLADLVGRETAITTAISTFKADLVSDVKNALSGLEVKGLLDDAAEFAEIYNGLESYKALTHANKLPVANYVHANETGITVYADLLTVIGVALS